MERPAMKRIALPLFLFLLLCGQTLPADTATSRLEAATATAIAGADLTAPLFLCRADSWQTVRAAMTHSDEWLEPVKAFDNLYYVWALRSRPAPRGALLQPGQMRRAGW